MSFAITTRSVGARMRLALVGAVAALLSLAVSPALAADGTIYANGLNSPGGTVSETKVRTSLVAMNFAVDGWCARMSSTFKPSLKPPPAGIF